VPPPQATTVVAAISSLGFNASVNIFIELSIFYVHV
jgi:hypothetical protein